MPSGFRNTVAVLAVLKAKLAALQWNGAPAFNKVEIFDMTDLQTALKELLLYADRVCLIVHDIEQFENERKGNQLHCRQWREVTLMIADKNIANRQKAMLGDDVTPGALNLKDLVLEQTVGLLQDGMYIEPVTGEQMAMEGKVRNELVGRVGFTLQLRLIGGSTIKNLGSQPIV